VNSHRAASSTRVEKPRLHPVTTACLQCPLRTLPLFLPDSREDIALIQSLKRGESTFASGATLIAEGQEDCGLYTLLEGWAFRYKTLSDGRRQILNFLLPGDFVGVQQKMTDAASHGVEAITAVRACTFSRDALWELHKRRPSIGFNITWITAHEESLVDDNLLSTGRRSAQERLATALILLYKRVKALEGVGFPEHSRPRRSGKLGRSSAVYFPLTQQHLADALGLSLAHVNKTLRKLEKRGSLSITDAVLTLHNTEDVQRLADVYGDGTAQPRPII
jgi:CRP-like cAMP-binding protein